jgi:hypothetical protein
MIFDLKEFSEERWNNFVLVYTPCDLVRSSNT